MAKTAKGKGKVKAINLALQGSGSHGAFAWGVLDRLVEDERIAIEGISATSAGATNAAIFAYGLATGGRDGAKRALHDFWRHISGAAAPKLSPADEFDKQVKEFWSDTWKTMKAFFPLLGRMTMLVSPYEFNPHNINPLRPLLERSIDFSVLRRPDCPVKLFLCGTNVRTGRIRVFDREVMSVECVLASACLPTLFQSVEIDGEFYWDGGYVGNPALFPLIYNCASRDIVVVHINPSERPVPRTAPDILNRINEVSFNSSLLREMRAIAFVTRLIEDGIVDGTKVRHIFMHEITADDMAAMFSIASMMNIEWEFLQQLHAAGREHAEEWLEANFDRLGAAATVDVQKKYG
jgi:NTE family protein